MNTRSRLLCMLAVAAAALLFVCEPGLAQCAMCKQNVAQSADAASAARGLNLAILVLLLPPVAIFTGIFGLIYRYRNIQDKE